MKPFSRFFSRFAYNSVIWARKQVPTLPMGLWTLNDKRQVINTRKPSVGSVVVMRSGLFGCLGLVTDASNGMITIKEANFYSFRVSERRNTPKLLKVIGYFNPNL